jgi:hypothetical protein
MAYGTGTIPFVRTSDITNYEIRADQKQGVGPDVYAVYAKRQDVKSGDILFVRDGTYLIGNTAMVTDENLPLLIQSHVLRFRLADDAPIDRFELLAALNTPIVRRQLRSKQFTADIIDTVGNRYQEVLLPIPKDRRERDILSATVRGAVTDRAALRYRLGFMPLWLEGLAAPGDFIAGAREEKDVDATAGFLVQSSVVGSRPLIPRYYSPSIDKRLAELAATHDLVSVGELVEAGSVTWSTGIEVGKLAYGGGGPPFVRTSDLSTWELKVDPKQTVTKETYERHGPKQDVQTDDILLVRDGTYLVGTSAIVTNADLPLLFAGGLYKLRAKSIDPYLLLTLLDTPIVRRQIRSKQFTRDIIDTLGKRLFEVYLPFPKDQELQGWIASEARRAVADRVALRSALHDAALQVEGDDVALAEEAELD